MEEYLSLEDYCNKKGKTVDEVYKELNNLPSGKKQGELINIKIMPDFFHGIFRGAQVDKIELVKFYNHFVSWYLDTPLFRKLTDGCIFLFADEKYLGFYKNWETLNPQIDILNETTNDITIYEMYPDIIYEK